MDIRTKSIKAETIHPHGIDDDSDDSTSASYKLVTLGAAGSTRRVPWAMRVNTRSKNKRNKFTLVVAICMDE